VSNQILKEMYAVCKQQDSERLIAKAELRRLAKAARHAGPSSALAVTAPLSRAPSIEPVVRARRSLGRGLFALLGRRATA
jgi:hypothetical protein